MLRFDKVVSFIGIRGRAAMGNGKNQNKQNHFQEVTRYAHAFCLSTTVQCNPTHLSNNPGDTLQASMPEIALKSPFSDWYRF